MARWCLILAASLAPWVASSQAVTGAGTPAAGAGATPVPTAPALSCTLDAPLDRMATPSSDCLACHDGSKTASGASDARSGHRYDVEYHTDGKPDLRRDPTGYDSRVVLPGGKLTCCTCHDPASSLPYHLAAPTSGAVERRLCVACHVQ